MSFTKVHQSILQSSLWCEDSDTKVVWITLLALADKHGEVMASVPGLARTAGVPLEKCKAALEKFLSPDPHSRTPDLDGRRIEQIDGGWSLVNYAKYRHESSKEDEKEKNAARQRRYRDRHAPLHVTDMALCVTPSNGAVTPSRDIAEAEAEANANNSEGGYNRHPIPPPSLSSEIPDLKQAKAMIMTCGIPDAFIELAHADWTENGGRNSQNVPKPWPVYVKGRWRYEQADWRNGTHRANKSNGGPSTARGGPSKGSVPDHSKDFWAGTGLEDK